MDCWPEEEDEAGWLLAEMALATAELTRSELNGWEEGWRLPEAAREAWMAASAAVRK